MRVQIETTEPRSAPERRDEIRKAEPGPTGLPTGRLVTSPFLVRLAARLGIRVNDLTARLSPETVRATKLPVIEIANPDGTFTYKHPSGIIETPQQR